MKYNILTFIRDITELTDQILPNIHKYDYVYGVPRGGLFLAGSLSFRLNLQLMLDLDTSKRVLIVDDVVDSGKTREMYKDFDFASLHVKTITPKNLYPTFYVRKESEYIDYFWETYDD